MMKQHLTTRSQNGEVGSPTQPNHELLQITDIMHFIGFAWRHKVRIGLAIAAAIAVGWIIKVNSTVVYESRAQLLVINKAPLGLDGVGRQPAVQRGEPTTELMVIKSPWFVQRVIDEHNLLELASLEDVVDPIQHMINSLVVVHDNEDDEIVQNSMILKFAYRSPYPDECPFVVKAFMDTYQAYLHESDRGENENVIELITQKTIDTQDELQDREAAYHDYRKAAPVLTQGVVDSTITVQQLADVELKRVDLQIRRAETESRLSAVHQALREGRTVPGGIFSEPFRHENLNVSIEKFRHQDIVNDKLLPLLIEERTLAADFGAGYPRLQQLRDQIEATRELYSTSSLKAAPARELDNPAESTDAPSATASQLDEPLQEYIESLEQELKGIAAAERSLDGQIKALTDQIKHEREQARQLALHELKSERHLSGIERVERLHDTLITQLRSVDLSKDYGGYNTTVISPPSQQEAVAPNLLLILALSTLIGLIGGFGWATWSEFAESTCRSPEAVRAVGLPMLGTVPALASRFGQRNGTLNGHTDPILVTKSRPESVQAESFRALRTALYYSNPSDARKTVQITSPTTGDGKSTLAANLAISIAQSGKRVLLIDADLRQPRIDQLFHLDGTNGLANVLSGELEPVEAIQACDIDCLSVLPAGPNPANPADLLSSSRLRELLSLVRDQFDFVLVDSPPLLPVSDARVLSALVDGVILTVRPSRKTQNHLRASSEILQLVDATVLGVVMTGNSMDTYLDRSAYRSSSPRTTRADDLVHAHENNGSNGHTRA